VTSAPLLFVHGSMHGAWCWDDVRALLARRGISSRAVDLPGHGTRAGEAQLASMDAYAGAVLEELELMGAPAVLVGHSMAGQVVARVTVERPAAVRRLVLVNAQVLRDGESHESTLPPPVAQQYRRLLAEQGGIAFRLPDEEIHRRWLQDMPFDDPRVTRALGLVTAQPGRPLRDRAVHQDVASTGVPVTDIRSDDDAGPFERTERFVSRLAPGTERVRVPGAHDCMISRPDALAEVLAPATIAPLGQAVG
jgi:pimeloyl-ACP methyl ester carboxylesterase